MIQTNVGIITKIFEQIYIYFMFYFLWYVKKNRYLLFVHPPGWRKPSNERSKYKNLFKKLTEDNSILYLEIHNSKDGIKTFKCGTRYDWYLLQKSKNKSNTIIKDEIGKIVTINLRKYEWLGNYYFNIIDKLLHKNKFKKCCVIFSSNIYETRRKWVKKEKSNEYKFILIDAINKNKTKYRRDLF